MPVCDTKILGHNVDNNIGPTAKIVQTFLKEFYNMIIEMILLYFDTIFLL
jgi:hypothetical protein